MSQKGEKYARAMERRLDKLEKQITFAFDRSRTEREQFFEMLYEAEERRAEDRDNDAKYARRRERAAENSARKWRAASMICLAAAILAAVLLMAAMSAAAESGTPEGTVGEEPVIVQAMEPVQTMEPMVREGRYPALTDRERELIARVVYLEARGEPAEGQQAVAEVILNRVAAENFPDSVESVVHQKGQFATAERIEEAAPGEAQYKAVDDAIYGEPVLPADVVYFSREGENDHVWGTIGGHVFCHQYIWE